MSKFLIVGLGNPGKEYEGTRHNIGFDVVNILAQELNISWQSLRYGELAQGKFKGKPIILLKPSTFMNLSGEAVRYWLQAENISVENVLIVVDELALPFGKIRLNPKGSDGGHNGLKSIQSCLNTTQYPRLRFGIGNEYGKGYNANYVLGNWNENEKSVLTDRLQQSAEACKAFIFMGLVRASNLYNGK